MIGGAAHPASNDGNVLSGTGKRRTSHFQTFIRFLITHTHSKRSKGAIMNRLNDMLTTERNQRLLEEARNERLAQEARRFSRPQNWFQRRSTQSK
jgi:hypothetical protein